jgi:hypothetical protein
MDPPRLGFYSERGQSGQTQSETFTALRRNGAVHAGTRINMTQITRAATAM